MGRLFPWGAAISSRRWGFVIDNTPIFLGERVSFRRLRVRRCDQHGESPFSRAFLFYRLSNIMVSYVLAFQCFT